MTFLHIPANGFVFVDANIFIYYFTPDPVLGPTCQQLFDSIAMQEFNAYTSQWSVARKLSRSLPGRYSSLECQCVQEPEP